MGYLSDYANNVTQILSQLGQQQGQAALQRGQAWQQGLSQVGQAIGQIPAQIAAQRAAQQESVLRGQNIDANNRTIADANALDSAWKVGAKPDGSLDVDAVLANVPGHLQSATRKSLTEYQTALLNQKKTGAEIQKLNDEHAQSQKDAFAALALGVQQHGYDPGAFTFAISRAVKDGLIDSDQAKQFIQNLTPDKLKGVIDATIAQSPKALESLKNIAQTKADEARIPGLVAEGQKNAAIAANMSPEGLTPDQQREHNDRIAALTQQQRQWEQDFGIKKSELGVRQATNAREQDKFNATYGAGLTENGQPMPVSDVSKAIAEYRMPPPNPRSAAYQSRMAEVMRVNPAYDATNWDARRAMRTKYTSGAQGDTIVAMNTAIGHLDQLAQAMKDLNSGDVQAANRARNFIKTQTGSADVTNMQTIKTFLDGELAAISKKGMGSDKEIEHMRELGAAVSSPAQMSGFIDKAIPLIGSKLAAMDYQYHQTMGEADPFNALSPDSQSILKGRGFDPKHPSAAGRGDNGSPQTSTEPDYVWDAKAGKLVKNPNKKGGL